MRNIIKYDSYFPHYGKSKIRIIRSGIGVWVVNFIPKGHPSHTTELAAFATRKEAREYAQQVRCALRGL